MKKTAVPVAVREREPAFLPQEHSLRHRLQVERAEEGRVLDLLHRGSGGGRRVTADGFAAGAPLAPALRASPGGRGAGRTRAWVWTVASAGVWCILYGTARTTNSRYLTEYFTRRTKLFQYIQTKSQFHEFRKKCHQL